jgi:uroporphyrinogen-III decarboxylase
MLNDWVHANTTWKTFIHTDGAILPLIPEFVDAGFDILNPLQWTAKDMDARQIKEQFGQQLVFWGGTVDSQQTFPFGKPEQVTAEVTARIKDLAPGGGFIFNSMHNIQPGTPVENLMAFYEAYNQHCQYPIS